jgi:hypothetical protein
VIDSERFFVGFNLIGKDFATGPHLARVSDMNIRIVGTVSVIVGHTLRTRSAVVFMRNGVVVLTVPKIRRFLVILKVFYGLKLRNPVLLLVYSCNQNVNTIIC